MAEIRVLEHKTDVRETLELANNMLGDAEGVMVVILGKDGTQHLFSSTMSGMQKAFLIAFVNAYMAKWFRLGGDSGV